MWQILNPQRNRLRLHLPIRHTHRTPCIQFLMGIILRTQHMRPRRILCKFKPNHMSRQNPMTIVTC